MRHQVFAHGVLYQDDAADYITKRFGPQFTYENDSGGVSIASSVLDSFRRLTRDGVVWVVQDIERDGDVVRHICRLEAAKPDSEKPES